MRSLNGISKWCPRCRQHKLLVDPKTKRLSFGVDKHQHDGLHSHCRACRRDYRLLRKVRPEVQRHVGTEHPSRGSFKENVRALYDLLAHAGEAVTLITPSGKVVDWGELT